MFIAMNRFKVRKGSEPDFEARWLNRDSQLKTVPGFVEFHLLKGPEREDHVLYASHTIWASVEAFEGRTRSEAFRAAHRGAGDASGGPRRGGHRRHCRRFPGRRHPGRTVAAGSRRRRSCLRDTRRAPGLAFTARGTPRWRHAALGGVCARCG